MFPTRSSANDAFGRYTLELQVEGTRRIEASYTAPENGASTTYDCSVLLPTRRSAGSFGPVTTARSCVGTFMIQTNFLYSFNKGDRWLTCGDVVDQATGSGASFNFSNDTTHESGLRWDDECKGKDTTGHADCWNLSYCFATAGYEAMTSYRLHSDGAGRIGPIGLLQELGIVTDETARWLHLMAASLALWDREYYCRRHWPLLKGGLPVPPGGGRPLEIAWEEGGGGDGPG